MGILHTHYNNEYLTNLFILNAQIELSSISMSKNDQNINKVNKYDVEASIDEVKNVEEESVFKYGFTALSNPKNVRLAIEGVARISGNPDERNQILEKDENDIPKILTMIYQELFPTFFLLSKSLNVSCLPHQIGSIGEQIAQEDNLYDENETPENETPQETTVDVDSESDSQDTLEEPKIENPDIAKPTV